MSTFIKHYIGKGKTVGELQIIKVTCKIEDLVRYSYEYDGVKYVSFEVARMKSPDKFNRDHSVYVSQKEEELSCEINVETHPPTITKTEVPQSPSTSLDDCDAPF